MRLRQRADDLERQARALLHQADRERHRAARWERGADGERTVGRLLDGLGERGWVVLHDRRRPGTVANVDHLLVGPAGVVVVDSKSWSGPVSVTTTGLRSGASDRSREADKVLATAALVTESLRQAGSAAPVHAAIAFPEDVGLAELVRCRGVVVGSVQQVTAGLVNAPGVLAPHDVRAVAAHLSEAFVPHRAGAPRARRASTTSATPRTRGRHPGGSTPAGRRRAPSRPARRPRTSRTRSGLAAAARELVPLLLVLAVLALVGPSLLDSLVASVAGATSATSPAP